MYFNFRSVFSKFPEDRGFSLGFWVGFHDGEWLVVVGLGLITLGVGSDGVTW